MLLFGERDPLFLGRVLSSPPASRAGAAGSGSSASAGAAGGGGGGGPFNGLAGNGGSGLVIIRYTTADATITIGSGLISSTTTSGSDTIVTFTAGTGTVTFS